MTGDGAAPRAYLRCTMLKTTGTKIRVATVANANPPMTARPSGAFCSPPSPKPRAIGAMPMIMASAVINTGRKRTKPASSAAATGSPSASKRGHGQRSTGGKQQPHDARKCGRQRSDDDEWIAPRLEIDHDQQIDQHDGAEQAEQKSGERPVHRLHLAEQRHRASLGRVVRCVLEDVVDVRRNRAEITPLCGGVDLNHRLDVVL